MTADPFLLAAAEQLPSDIGKSGPLGLVLTLVLFIATALLVKSMSGHLKRLPSSFDPPEQSSVVVPDTPAELVETRPEPGQELLDRLRRAPLAIEPPRSAEGRPADPGTRGRPTGRSGGA